MSFITRRLGRRQLLHYQQETNMEKLYIVIKSWALLVCINLPECGVKNHYFSLEMSPVSHLLDPLSSGLVTERTMVDIGKLCPSHFVIFFATIYNREGCTCLRVAPSPISEHLIIRSWAVICNSVLHLLPQRPPVSRGTIFTGFWSVNVGTCSALLSCCRARRSGVQSELQFPVRSGFQRLGLLFPVKSSCNAMAFRRTVRLRVSDFVPRVYGRATCGCDGRGVHILLVIQFIHFLVSFNTPS